ncbi:MAG: hypothetical protein Q9187_009558, partial [Circinaria calcarea]
MDFRSCGPAEDEKANREAKDGEESRSEAIFISQFQGSVDSQFGVQPKVNVGNIACSTDGAGNDDADKDQAKLAKPEAVERRIDEKESLEEGVVDGVNESWLDERVDGDGVGSQMALGDLTVGVEARRIGDRAEASGTAKDRKSRSFGHEKQNENTDWAGKL